MARNHTNTIPSTSIRVRDPTKARLLDIQKPGESMDQTILRLLETFEIVYPQPKRRKNIGWT